MTRLIDANVVENALLEQMRFNADNNQKSRNMGLLQARNIIQNTSTVYDIEKVLEELKQAGYSDEYCSNRVVDIVKRGGVEK